MEKKGKTEKQLLPKSKKGTQKEKVIRSLIHPINI